ncbi:MAG TPA: MFS transporter [Candidatus Hydrogenedentes bacterium]|nr:MFS transporter [Candidatus Hydrogenedentota bacterium]
MVDSARERTRGYVLFVATLAAFLTPFTGSSVNVAIPAIGRELGLHATALSWVVTAYILAASALLLPFGRMADLYGRRKIFMAGIAIFTLSSLLSALTASAAILICGRALQGVGSAMIFSTGLAILTGVYEEGERGRVVGINTAAVYAGLSFGPAVGGALTHYASWRSIFGLNAALGIVALMATLRLRGEWRDNAGQRFDLAGALLYTPGTAALMYGIASAKTASYAAWIVMIGVALLAAFIWRERKARDPLLEFRLFRNGVFTFSSLAALIHYCATFAIGYLLSLYLQELKGLDPRQAGLVLLSQPALMTFVTLIAGRLSDRYEPRILASAGMGLTFLGIALLMPVDASTSVTYISVCLIVLGIGFGLFSSPNTNAIMSSVPKAHYGVASAALSSMRLLGQALSMSLVTFMFARHLEGRPATAAHASELLQGMHASLRCFAPLCLLAVLASLFRGRLHSKRSAPS